MLNCILNNVVSTCHPCLHPYVPVISTPSAPFSLTFGFVLSQISLAILHCPHTSFNLPVLQVHVLLQLKTFFKFVIMS